MQEVVKAVIAIVISSIMSSEIWVVPFFGQGHLLPTMELCKHMASINLKATLIISSNLSSTVPSSLRQSPLLEVIELPSHPHPPPQPGSDPMLHHHRQHSEMSQSLEHLISSRTQGTQDSRLPLFAVVDVMMSWTSQIFNKLEIPIVAFFTSGACSAALEYAMWKAHPNDLKAGEIRLLPGLPEDMALTESDLKTRPHKPPGGFGGPPPIPGAGFPRRPGGPGPPMMGPPRPGGPPPWLEETRGSDAFMINTCDDLEGPFLHYLANQVHKPVWGVGPLLPEQYWRSTGSLIHDRQVRTNNRQSNVTEDQVVAWLDSKLRRSVLYVSFGSEVGPDMEEYSHLAEALEESNRPFIWVIQPGSGKPGPPPQLLGGQPDSIDGYFPHGLEKRVGERGLIIYGWAPQLLILSHPSTGGFLSHCGWNSTVEAIGRGVPLLAWPIRGDQHYNAKLVVKHLKVGCMISDELSKVIEKDDIVKGIERLMEDEGVKKEAALVSARFEHGFPQSSMASLNAFKEFINNIKTM